MSGRDLGQCRGWQSDITHPELTRKPHKAKPSDFGYSDNRCRACETARKKLTDLRRRAEMRASTRPKPPPKPKPEPLKPRTPTKVAPGLPFQSVDNLLLLAEFGKPRAGKGIRARLAMRRREERIQARIGGAP